MVLKAVPIYASDQSDVLWLAPKAGRVGRSASGPLLPLAGRSDAAVWLVEGDIRGNRESAALCFLLCSSLMVIDKVGL